MVKCIIGSHPLSGQGVKPSSPRPAPPTLAVRRSPDMIMEVRHMHESHEERRVPRHDTSILAGKTDKELHDMAVDGKISVNDVRAARQDRESTKGDFTEYDRYIRLLTEAMRYKLRLNSHKGFLGDVDPATLMKLLRGEVSEVEEALQRGNYIETIIECADVANFALGIMINLIRRTTNDIPA